MDKLKYEGEFETMDIIRSYDFQPGPDRPDRYIQGVILTTDTIREMGCAKVYVIKITSDSGKEEGGRVGQTGYVPMEVDFMEYDGRVVKIA